MFLIKKLQNKFAHTWEKIFWYQIKKIIFYLPETTTRENLLETHNEREGERGKKPTPTHCLKSHALAAADNSPRRSYLWRKHKP